MRAPLKMNGKQFGRLTVVRLATQRNKDGKRASGTAAASAAARPS